MAATSNIREFSLGVRAAAQRVGAKVEDVTQAVALRALNGVVLGTRVDTGRARGNWQVQLGSPPEGHDETLMDKVGSATIGRGARVISTAQGDRVVWLHNGVPYIGILEDRDKMVAGNVQALSTWLQSQGWGR